MTKFGIIAIVGLALLAVTIVAASESSSSNADESKSIKLPEPRIDGGIAVERALNERRSIRSFGKDGLTLEEVSQLLWAAQGVTDDQEGHRTAPSAMARYPLQVYLLAGNVTGLPTGIYHYSPQGHSLTVIHQGNIDNYYNAAAGFEAWITTAPAIFVITGDLSSMNTIPGRDSRRWVYVEAGAAAENLLLEVVSLGLVSTYTAGFDADKTQELLGLPEGEVTIGVLPVGRKA
jgi:SagB-type dehydrogenase family enzyme